MATVQPGPHPTEQQLERLRLAFRILVEEALAEGVVVTIDQVIDNPCKPREFRMDIKARPARGRY
jgi:hypothetical protein